LDFTDKNIDSPVKRNEVKVKVEMKDKVVNKVAIKRTLSSEV